MPWYINKSGIPVNILPENEEKARRDGCRLATDDDMQAARGDRSHFRLPRVDGYERGALGDQPIVVVGCGPSMLVETPDTIRVQCNPRAHSLPARFAIALDGIYWDRKELWEAHKASLIDRGYSLPECYTPRFVHYQCTDVIRSFNMPVRVIRGQADDYLEVRTQTGIQKMHFTLIAAVLFAQYLSTGPVIMLGNDFSGHDAISHGYLARQYPSFKAAASLWSNVYMHPANGPSAVRDLFPIWDGVNGEPIPAAEEVAA